MRGRTLSNSFIILDEAQNTTPEQMKMFLTRIGFGSKAVITGDVTQIDLPKGQPSGLVQAERILEEGPRHRLHPLQQRRRGPPSRWSHASSTPTNATTRLRPTSTSVRRRIGQER